MSGWQAIHIASMQNRPFAESKSACPSARVRATGFSQSTGFPAAKASRACSRWWECGLAM